MRRMVSTFIADLVDEAVECGDGSEALKRTAIIVQTSSLWT